MNSVESVYFERGVKFFEIEKYENALEDWIYAYKLGYEKKRILDILYQCFIEPNDREFRKNFENNNVGYTQMAYEECMLDFIPVSDDKYYIFNKQESKFEGYFCCRKTILENSKFEFPSVLYTDTWDIREIIADAEEYQYGMIYLLMGELEKKFVSFFKLPFFEKLYMKKIVLLHDITEMKQFFLEHENFYMPQKLITLNETKYQNILLKLKQEKVQQEINNEGRNLLFIKGQSQYGVARRMVEDMAKAFQKLGYNVLVLDGLQRQIDQQLEEVGKRYLFDAVITFNAMFLEFESVRRLGKKFCTIMGDHPIWNYTRLECADQNTILWYGDFEDIKYVKKYYPNVGRTDFCLGTSTYLPGKENYSERKIDIVFTGGYSRPETIYDRICQMYTGNVKEMVKLFMEQLRQDPSKTYEAALMDVLYEYGMSGIDDKKFNEMAIEFEFVNKYIRAYFRDAVIRKIVESGIEIHVSGNGWESFESPYKDNLIIERNDWYTARKLIANAKISLNIMPWFKNGFHERAIISMLSGAVVLTDVSGYIEQQFQDMENIAMFHLEDLDELVQKINFLLSNIDKSENIANKGHEYAVHNFTWDIRAKQMMDILQEELGEKLIFKHEGKTLSLGMNSVQWDATANKALMDLKDIEEVLDSFTGNELIDEKDYEYCINRLKTIACNLISMFPNINVGTFVWERIMNIKETNPKEILELMKMQVAYLIRIINRGSL